MYLLHRSPTAPNKIYSSSLKPFCLGHGMWYPEPHESGEVQIGDVGFLKDGAFIRLFNLDTAAPDKKVTYWKKPFDIADPPDPDMFKVDKRRRPIAPRPYRSHGVQKQRYHAYASLSPGPGVSAGIDGEYTCTASYGAVLALKSEAQEQTIFENIDLKQYVLQHHEGWCTYVRDVLRQNVKPSAIVMVSGWVKTGPDWAAAAFSSTNSRKSASLKAGAGGSAGADAGFEHTDSVDGPEMHRHGEKYLDKGSDTSLPRARDQSVFIKRFKVRRRLGIVRTVVAGAGYHRLPRGGGSRGHDDDGHIERGMDFDEGKNEGEVPDLLDILLDYIFETTVVEIAVASDDDVVCIVGEEGFEDFSNSLRNRQPPVEVDGSDLPVGFFRKESIIRQQRERDVARRVITRADWIKWPNITMEGASKSDDVEVFLGSTVTNAHTVKLKVSTFTDLQHPSKACRCFAFSPDGRLLAASFQSSSITLWRLPDGILVQKLHEDEHKADITCLAFSPDSTEVFAGAVDKIVTAWNIRTGTIRLRFGPHEGEISAIACSPYEPYIGAATKGTSSLYVWERSTGHRLATASNPNGFPWREIIFVPPTLDTSNVYVRSLKSSLIYNIRSCTRLRSINIKTGTVFPGNGYFSQSVSHYGDRILVKTVGQDLQILDARSGELQIAIPNSENLAYPAGFSADDEEVYATYRNAYAAQSFDSRTGDVRYHYKLSGNVIAGAYSPDGAYLAFCTTDGKVQVHDPISGTFLAKTTVDPHRTRTDYAIAFTTDGKSLVVHDGYGSLQILNVSDMVRAR